ncbi:MAG: sulfate adenylyltransferase [Nitrospinae bacterium RIFCSPLOWO2_12_FULL_45_22]|nr:MAG: sulfate adenylyltransferase [Nitrospinae bacterium RIFCSPLOWO2_12_FULL_45_22]
MDHLDELESKSIYIIREAYYQFRDIGMLWSIGKDSTTLLWLCRKAFLDQIPFPVIHIDTAYKFPQIYGFRDRYAREWGLALKVARNEEALMQGVGPNSNDKLKCCTELKTIALKQLIAREGYKAILLGIRRDEHGIRAKERYFSPRDQQFTWDYKNQPAELWDQYKSEADDETHLRVHPLLHWTEVDIWSYIKRENIPFIDLYRAVDGKRYRSIGCETCCDPIPSEADDIDSILDELINTKTRERAGRAQDKEQAYMMQKLRALGYM